MNKILNKTLFLLICTFLLTTVAGFPCFVVYASEDDPEVIPKPTVNYKTITFLYPGETYDPYENLVFSDEMPSWPDASEIIWKSSNPDVIKIIKEGDTITIGDDEIYAYTTLLFAKDPGTSTITASIDKTEVTFTGTVKKISLSNTSKTICIGDSFTLKLNGYVENEGDDDSIIGYNYPEWDLEPVSDDAYDIIDYGAMYGNSDEDDSWSRQTFSGAYPGKQNIVVTLCGRQYKCSITVKKPSLRSKVIRVKKGKKANIPINNINREYAKELYWDVEDMDIAEFDENCTIIGLKKGKTKIYTEIGDFVLSAVVKVK